MMLVSYGKIKWEIKKIIHQFFDKYQLVSFSRSFVRLKKSKVNEPLHLPLKRFAIIKKKKILDSWNFISQRFQYKMI